MLRGVLFSLIACALAACAYILPATWRSFRADPDDAAPAVTRALDSRGIVVATFDQAKRRIVTDWVVARDGVDTTRDRYVISWERDKEEGLTMYVRHEAQDLELEGAGVERWSTPYHDTDREDALLNLIQKELEAGG